MRQVITVISALTLAVHCRAQIDCNVQQQEVFLPQNKPVAVASGRGAPTNAKFVVFKSALRVNTDGAPNSYHPYDLRGETKAINDIANAIAVSRNGRKVSYAEKIRVFEDFRDHEWNVPLGYKITWQNVLASRTLGLRKVPCVFTLGPYQGYFGSLTALKNNLSAEAAGECSVANQLDARYVPALVIAGGDNPLRHFEVDTGDLLLAINPGNGAIQPAVVGDSGPPDNLGEGSVALNMSLLRETRQPTNYKDARELDTGSQEVLLAIIPRSAAYKLRRPYDAQNIAERVRDWLAFHGYGDPRTFAKVVQRCASMLGPAPNSGQH